MDELREIGYKIANGKLGTGWLYFPDCINNREYTLLLLLEEGETLGLNFYDAVEHFLDEIISTDQWRYETSKILGKSPTMYQELDIKEGYRQFVYDYIRSKNKERA